MLSEKPDIHHHDQKNHHLERGSAQASAFLINTNGLKVVIGSNVCPECMGAAVATKENFAG